MFIGCSLFVHIIVGQIRDLELQDGPMEGYIQ